MPVALLAIPAPAESWDLWDSSIERRYEVGLRQSSWGMRLRRPDLDYTFGIMIRSAGVLLGGAVVERVRWGRRHAFYRIADGPVLPYDDQRGAETLRGILASVQRRRHRDQLAITHLRIEPRWATLPPAVEALWPRLARVPSSPPPPEILRLDLTASETALLARMGPSARASAALARGLGLTAVEDLSEQGVADYMTLRRPAGPTMGGRALDEDRLRALIVHLREHRNGSLLFAEDDTTRLAGVVAIILGSRLALVDCAVPHPAQRSVARTFLHFELMRHGRARHCVWYDVGAISHDPDAPERALGGDLTRPVAPFEVVLDPAGYEEFLRRRGTEARPS